MSHSVNEALIKRGSMPALFRNIIPLNSIYSNLCAINIHLTLIPGRDEHCQSTGHQYLIICQVTVSYRAVYTHLYEKTAVIKTLHFSILRQLYLKNVELLTRIKFILY